MSEFASVAFLAQAALVMFADKVVDATALGGRRVVSIGTEDAARAIAGLVLGTYRSCDLRGSAESWEGAS